MGALWNGQCYENDATAMSAYMSAKTFDALPGTTTYLNQFVWDDATATWRHKTYTVGTNGLWTLKTNVGVPTVNFPDCDPVEKFTDGMTIGWGIATVMVAAYCYNLVRKSAR